MSLADEQRKEERVEFFLLPVDQFPVWVFKPEGEEHAHAGLVVNVSRSGLQILTDAHHPLTTDRYTLHFLGDGRLPAPEPDRVSAVRMWTKPEGAKYLRNGFELEADMEDLSVYFAQHRDQASGHQWLRCVVIPLPGC